MTDVAEALERIRKIAGERGGVKRLADEAELPYTTVHSFARRDSQQSLEVFEKLAAAAERIAPDQPDEVAA